ncbi:SSI family serine proteinase inhibitor [Actinoplanes sp. NEAU-A12]|uniref:SSI family serine proteinase inhibitor n=1 Tax=Actinoplanes sandaracinus TaxID=3045177 RepID=A0ABT6WDY1_9ACTN|nr:SSI family serine proteinase inhibitor [Actinoplanes sandaracinus]MDI6097930.1 SSI family serine proteinase inhibitor [Actinoplanes sandaracinus]
MIGLVTAFAVLAGPAGPASASADTSLTLTNQAKTVKLTCGPAGGGHPKAGQACATLSGIGGNPARLKGGDSLCMLLYKPVTARLKGTWRGKTMKWQQTYGNSCEMARATGVLFDF